MTKKDDMMKLFRGGKRDFKIELKPIKILFFCLCFSASYFSQVPINGFCSIETFNAPAGFKNLLIPDKSAALNSGLILYSQESKKIVVLEKDEDLNYTVRNIIAPVNNISAIISVQNGQGNIPNYVIASRRGRTVGYYELSNNKRFNLLAKVSFDSYPENICAANIDHKGNPEIMVFGSAFKGLSVLSLKDNVISEAKVENQFSYSEAVFADISNDGYQDIAAFNLFSNEIEIFYNDLAANFRRVSSIKVNKTIQNLIAMDINKDFYTDLIFCSGKSIHILKGDFQSSFDSSTVLVTDYTPHHYSIADFNGDRFLDIAYADTVLGLLLVVFGKGEDSYYPEVLYVSKKNIVDLNISKTDRYPDLVLLTSYGEISIISKINSVSEELNFVPALQPAAVSSVSLDNNQGAGFCYVDELIQSLVIILNSSNKIPYSYFSIPVSNNHSEIIVEGYEPLHNEFYCYTTGKKMLEIICFNDKDFKFETHQLYIPGAIRDIKIGRDGTVSQIYVLFDESGRIKINKYEYHDFRFTVREYPEIDENIIAPILFTDGEVKIYYWKFKDDSLGQYYSFFHSANENKNQTGILSRNDFGETKAIIQSILSYNPLKIITLLVKDKILYSVITGDNLFYTTDLLFNKDNFFINSGTKFNYKQSRKNFYKSIYYAEENRTFNEIEVNLSEDNLAQTELFQIQGLSGFTMQKFSDGKEYLIYTQPEEGKITLKQLIK